MSFKPYTEKIKKKKIGICIVLIRIHHPGSGSADPDPDPNPHQNYTDPKHCFLEYAPHSLLSPSYRIKENPSFKLIFFTLRRPCHHFVVFNAPT